jgi:Flp pilus assembly protein TadG
MMRMLPINIYKTRAKNQSGAAAVEMALLLPMLLLMADGVLELGLMMHNQSVLISATHMAARAGITAGTAKLNTAQIAAIASAYCNLNLISPGAAQAPVITVVQASVPTYPAPLQVSAQYPFNGLFVGGLMAVFQSTPVQTASTVMYNE